VYLVQTNHVTDQVKTQAAVHPTVSLYPKTTLYDLSTQVECLGSYAPLVIIFKAFGQSVQCLAVFTEHRQRSLPGGEEEAIKASMLKPRIMSYTFMRKALLGIQGLETTIF
jgi:hypothetical protein